MADVVAAPAVGGRLAVVERLGEGREASGDAEVVEEAVGIESKHVLEGLVAHAEEIGVEDFYLFEAKGKGEEVREWMRVCARAMLCDGRYHFGGGFGSGEGGAAVEYVEEEVTSDHGSVLSQKRG